MNQIFAFAHFTKPGIGCFHGSSTLQKGSQKTILPLRKALECFCLELNALSHFPYAPFERLIAPEGSDGRRRFRSSSGVLEDLEET